jgi:hypothetical protein
MRFSMKRARAFTVCAPCRCCRIVVCILVALALVGAALWLFCPCNKCCEATEAPAAETPAAEAPAA